MWFLLWMWCSGSDFDGEMGGWWWWSSSSRCEEGGRVPWVCGGGFVVEVLVLEREL